MRELKDFIKNKKIDFKKLEEFGFKLKENSYYYHTSLLKNQFKMYVKINLDKCITLCYSEILAKIKEEIEFLKEGEEEVDDTRSMKFLYISLGISIITLIIVIITFFLKLK